jgi:hypothetical protein
MAGKSIVSLREQELILIKNESIPAALPGTTKTVIPCANIASYLQLTLTGGFDIAGGGADGVLAPEGILSMISEVRLTGTSKSGKSVGQIFRADFGALYVLQSMLRHSLGYRANPTPITKGATPTFAVDASIDFEMLHSDMQRKTNLNMDDLSDLTLECDWRPLGTDVFTAGTITATTTPISLAVSTKRYSDAVAKGGKYGLKIVGQREKALNGASSDFTFDGLQRGKLLRGILIKTFTRNAVTYHTPVDTILSNITVLGDNKPVRYYDSQAILKAENQRSYGLSPITGYCFVDFMQGGHWDTILRENQYGTIDLKLSVANIANGIVRVYPVEVQL